VRRDARRRRVRLRQIHERPVLHRTDRQLHHDVARHRLAVIREGRKPRRRAAALPVRPEPPHRAEPPIARRAKRRLERVRQFTRVDQPGHHARPFLSWRIASSVLRGLKGLLAPPSECSRPARAHRTTPQRPGKAAPARPYPCSTRPRAMQKPNYDILALDLDGTLLNPRGEVSEANLAAVDAARKAGIEVVICTGRGLIESKRAIAAIRAHERLP